MRLILPLLAVVAMAFAQAGSAPTIQIVPEAAALAGTILKGNLKGDETAEYVIAGAAGQIL